MVGCAPIEREPCEGSTGGKLAQQQLTMAGVSVEDIDEAGVAVVVRTPDGIGRAEEEGVVGFIIIASWEKCHQIRQQSPGLGSQQGWRTRIG